MTQEPTVTIQEFAKLVGKMRAEQKKLFRSDVGSFERAEAFHKANVLEPKVDQAIKEILEDRP